MKAFAAAGFLLALFTQAPAVQSPAPAAPQAPIERRDPELDMASNLIGEALFLRCFCADDTIAFTASGAPEGRAKTKTVDWTLSGVNVQKTERRSPGEIELDGVRVAVRFAPDRREWDRHPQKTEPMRLTVPDPGEPGAFRRELEAIFSVGIDRALQRSTPPYWQHSFDPGMPWPSDGLGGVPVAGPGKLGAAGQAATPPVQTHKAAPGYTAAAQRDRVQGFVQLQFVVDPDGVPRRIVVAQPLGYGLDAEAAEAAAKLRFTPAMLDGEPVAYPMLLKQEFAVVAPPQ